MTIVDIYTNEGEIEENDYRNYYMIMKAYMYKIGYMN